MRSATTYSNTPAVRSNKPFRCTFPSCGKSFSRAEHVTRHAQNHGEGSNTCRRCSTHFARHDLLARHMARHKEKDDEAGGEGLGRLKTIKKLWRDANGNIVNTSNTRHTSWQTSTRRGITRADKNPCMRAQNTEDKKIMTPGKGTIAASPPAPTIGMSAAVDTGVQTRAEGEREAERNFEEEMGRHSWLDIDPRLSEPGLGYTALPSYTPLVPTNVWNDSSHCFNLQWRLSISALPEDGGAIDPQLGFSLPPLLRGDCREEIDQSLGWVGGFNPGMMELERHGI